MGRLFFWPAFEQLEDDAEGTDVWAFVRGFITVTPMALDVAVGETDAALRSLALWSPAATTVR
jgi:broad specificity polyphosphatase/5'/3'-nucleotidase SurE